jgi:glycosyltransferase involved in cell wall biosynthesis
MHVLHAYKDFDPPVKGGIETYISRLARIQQQWGKVSVIVCARDEPTTLEKWEGVTILRVCEWGRALSTPIAPAFVRWLRTIPADVIVLHVPNPMAETAWLLAREPACMVVRYHSDVVRQRFTYRAYRPIQRRVLKRARFILPTSREYMESSEVLREFRSVCRVVPLGVDAAQFTPPATEKLDSLRSAYGGEFVFFSGVHRYYKGLPYLVEAAEQIRAPVVIAGDGPERARCMKMAESLSVPVYFPGALTDEDLIAHLHACAVFVFPSIERSEAFGLSILEAHACAKPVVATTLDTGVVYVNRHGETGYNVPPRDPRALAEAVNALLQQKELCRIMGEQARRRVEKEFNIHEIARREWEWYSKAAALHDSVGAP